MSILFWLGVMALVVYLLLGLDLLHGSRSIGYLRQVAPDLPPDPPRVTVIAAARNEARHIRQALPSLLRLDYPDYELIVLNDRSEDTTGAILDEMAEANPRLRVIHINSLPAGWLGKTHALAVGSRRATGKLILFTDADVVFEKTALTRAVTFFLKRKLDHLVVAPSLQMKGTLLRLFGESFALIFFPMFMRPWKAKDPESGCHIGIGAFNLIGVGAYQRLGGHETIRLRPDDDLKLGKMVKRGGFRQDILFGDDQLHLEWYSSLGEMIGGLEKNAFAGADYRVPLVLSGACFHSICSCLPFLALVVASGPARVVHAVAAGVILVLFIRLGRSHRVPAWHAAGFPLAALLFVYVLLRTMMLNLMRGGIYWRGTFYRLDELKENKV